MHPGHGESTGNATTILEYRDIISGLANQYGPFDAIIAHSFGVLAAFVALREADPVQARRLIAISGVSEFDYLVNTFCSRLRLRPQLNQQLRARIERDLFPGGESIWDRFAATYQAAKLPIPMLVVHDEDDDITDLTQSQRITVSYRDQVRTLITHELGHRTLRDLRSSTRSVKSSDPATSAERDASTPPVCRNLR